MNVDITFTLVAALVGSLVTYLIARRKNSGRVDTSEAGVLWEEGRLIRQELREELALAREENIALKKENAKMRASLDTQDQHIDVQSQKIEALEEKLKKWEGKR